MSQARLERVGSLYSRMTALLQSGTRRPEFRPLWYDVYEAHPPKFEPRWDRPGDETPLPKILYAEDRVRAQFHRQFGERSEIFDLAAGAEQTLCQRFVERFSLAQRDNREDVPFEEEFVRAVDGFAQEEGVDLRALDPEAARAGGRKDSAMDEKSAQKLPPKIQPLSFKELFSEGSKEEK